jgi:hypothetical protein
MDSVTLKGKSQAASQAKLWSSIANKGFVFDSSTGFTLPDRNLN